MRVEPYARINSIAFGSDEATVVSVLGAPRRISNNRRGERELHYPDLVVRFADGHLVEATADSRAVHLNDVVVQFVNLRQFLSQNDSGAFECVGFVVSPQYGIAFDPEYPSWVTAFPEERLSLWQRIAAK